MKTKKINAKLILNKEKISDLTSAALKYVQGGATQYVSCVQACGGGDINTTIYTCVCITSR